MTVESALLRIDTLQRALSDPSVLLAAGRSGGTAAPAQRVAEADASAPGSFAQTLQSEATGYVRLG